MLTEIQYRLLKAVAPGEPAQCSGSAYAGKSKLAVMLGPEAMERVRRGTVLDFGCGEGAEAVEMALAGATVIGLDIREEVLERGRARAAAAGVSDRCRFTMVADGPVDTVVTLDSFEHFGDPSGVLRVMYDLLRPGGSVLATFGPTWFHPYGGHLFSVFPWAHLLFSERALIRWRDDIRSDGATRFSEVAGGLNQMTIARFERLIAETPFRIATLETVPIRGLARLHMRATREFTTAIVRCRLEKPAA